MNTLDNVKELLVTLYPNMDTNNEEIAASITSAYYAGRFDYWHEYREEDAPYGNDMLNYVWKCGWNDAAYMNRSLK